MAAESTDAESTGEESTGEASTGEASVPTLGERLTGQGLALAARHFPAFPWAGPLAVATQRAAAFDTAHEERFARVEVDRYARRPSWPPAARPRWPAWPVPAPADPVPGESDARTSRPMVSVPPPHVSPSASGPPAP